MTCSLLSTIGLYICIVSIGLYTVVNRVKLIGCTNREKVQGVADTRTVNFSKGWRVYCVRG